MFLGGRYYYIKKYKQCNGYGEEYCNCIKHCLRSVFLPQGIIHGVTLPQGFSLQFSCVDYFVNDLIYFEVKYLFLDYIFISIEYITFGIRALSWAKKGRFFFFLFAEFSREKKGWSLQINFETF
jgi:hypothetical protein